MTRGCYENFIEFNPAGTTSFAAVKSFATNMAAFKMNIILEITTNKTKSEAEFYSNSMKLFSSLHTLDLNVDWLVLSFRGQPQEELPEGTKSINVFPLTRLAADITLFASLAGTHIERHTTSLWGHGNDRQLFCQQGER